MLELQLLGIPEIRLENQNLPRFSTAKAEGLFYYLATTRRSHPRTTLSSLFWSEMIESKARVNLSKALSELRDQVGDYVTITAQAVCFNPDLPYHMDREVFLATQKLTNGHGSIIEYEASANLYRGAFLEGFHVRNASMFEHWLATEREELRIAAVELHTKLAGLYEQSGNLHAAIAMLRRLLSLEPWNETIHLRLMNLLLVQGEKYAALHQFELCRLALADALDVEPGAEITLLYQKLRQNGSGKSEIETHVRSAALWASDTAQSTIPFQLPQAHTAFVGRKAEIDDLATQLRKSECRLLTLVGPGGIGKTRLAQEVARCFIQPSVASQFPEGVFFVNLMPVDSTAGIVAAIAETLGFSFYNSNSPQQQLFNYLRQRKLLLILDNFEHLTEMSPLISDLLISAPAVKVMMTSREMVPLHAAHAYSVQGLTCPPVHVSKDETAISDAVLLFNQSAKRHQPTFNPTTNLAATVAICRFVGGMPLAIELAAAWTKSLPCAQIAQALEKGATILQANLLDIPERHRNLRIVFEQSWQRLNQTEARVLSKLSIFRGGFTLSAAEQVAHASIFTLASLVENAWIRLDETGRYQIHELLRQFAQEKLAENEQEKQASAVTHAAFFLQQAALLKTSMQDKRLPGALATLQADIDNLRAAWLWAIQQPNLPGIAESIDTIYAFFLFTCRYSEGEALFSNQHQQLALLAERVDNPAITHLVTRIASRAAVFTFQLGDYQQPSQHFQSLLATARRDEATAEVALAYAVLGQIDGWKGNKVQAEAFLLESIALYSALGDRSSLASVLHAHAEMQAHAWRFEKATATAQACLELGMQLGRDDLIGNAHATLGYAIKSLGNPLLALEHYRQGAAYSEKSGDRLAYALTIGGVGIELCALGNEEKWLAGIPLIKKSYEICCEIGHTIHIVTRLFSLARSYNQGKRYTEAIRYAEECVQVASQINMLRGVSFALYTLGESYFGLDDIAMSRKYLKDATITSIRCGYAGLSHCTIDYALLLEKEAQQLSPQQAKDNYVEGVMLC